MKLITTRQLIRAVAERWNEQYKGWKCAQKASIGERLNSLNAETASSKEVDEIIGNSSWTHLFCDECGEEAERLVEIGQIPDYDSRTACVCLSCLQKALILSNENV